MARHLFGTDGIRGRANHHPMTVEVCLALGRALAHQVVEANPTERAAIAIGRDTRLSGDLFTSALAAGCLGAGADVLDLGILPTPGVALLTRELRAGAGLVISASHNPFWDNGVKVFDPRGFKLTDAQETELEALCRAPIPHVEAEAVGRLRRVDDAGDRYVSWLIDGAPAELSLAGVRLLVDCAHGACYRLAPRLFEALGAEVVTIGAAPDGRNINDGVGATAVDAAAARVAQGDADLGVSFDGDGDRLIVIDETGSPLDGDEMLGIAAISMKARGELLGDAVVATVMSNLGLRDALEAEGITLVRTSVGDRYVVEEMRRRGCNLGGEQSGHIIWLDRATTGDGMATALLILAERSRQGRPLSELRRVVTRFPQVLVNVGVRDKPALADVPEIAEVIQEAELALGRQGRVLVRYSGTEPKARVMVEGSDREVVALWADRIATRLDAVLGLEGVEGEEVE